MTHENWRDCQAWRCENLPMNTSSNEACKLFDICLSQVLSFRENIQIGGLYHSLAQMVNSDEDFIIGKCLKMGLEMLGTNALLRSSTFKSQIDDLNLKAEKLKPTLTRRELMHVKAIEYLHRGALPDAVDLWEQILIEHPTDILALKFNHSCYFYLGWSTEMHQSIARVLPFYKLSTPYYNYLYGMMAFGLAESNRFQQAKENALKGIDLNRFDAWAIHAYNHYNEYTGDWSTGKDFLLKTELDWSPSNLLSGHNYWHLALFYLELNQHEQVVDILDEKLLKLDSTLDLVNSSSLLLRLKLDGYKDLESLMPKWEKLKSGYVDRIQDHGYLYSDFHVAAILASTDSNDETQKYFQSLSDFINSDDFYPECDDSLNQFCSLLKPKTSVKNYLKKLNSEIAESLCSAIFFYEKGEFDKVVSLLYPIRYDIKKVGGSNAQRDIFEQILIHSALRSQSLLNRKLGISLLNERLIQNPSSDLTKRIFPRFSLD